MQSNYSNRESKSDRIIGILLASLSMFVVGYTATRVFLSQSSATNTSSVVNVIPHEATLWKDLGK
jgi:hypothetical protein